MFNLYCRSCAHQRARERTAAAGSTAVRLRVVSKCAFVGAYKEKETSKSTPDVRFRFLLSVYHRPSSLCHSPQMSRWSYVFGGRIHPLHITSQKTMLKEYAKYNGFLNCQFYIYDGYSGTYTI